MKNFFIYGTAYQPPITEEELEAARQRVREILANATWQYHPDDLPCSRPPGPDPSELFSRQESQAQDRIILSTASRWPNNQLLYKIDDSLPQAG